MLTRTQIAAWLRRRGWALNLVFILLGGYFVAGAMSSVLARSIRIAPGAAPVATASSAASRPSPTNTKIEYQAIAARNLLGAQRENLQPVVEETTAEPTGPATYNPNDLRKCTVAASLRATLVAERKPEWSIAVMFNNASHETRVYSINEGSNQIASDATVFEIRSREIVVRRSDHYELCVAEGEGEGTPSAMASPYPPPAEASESAPAEESAPADDSGAVQKTGENEWSVSRDYLEKEVLNNLSKVATQARIVPSFKNGKPNGFKLFSIKPKSIFSQIGMQNGDVIHKINGYEMTSPDRALEVYQKLKDAGSINVEYTRRGTTGGSTFNIRP